MLDASGRRWKLLEGCPDPSVARKIGVICVGNLRGNTGDLARSAAEDASPDYNSDAEGARFSSWALPGSLAVTRGILVSFFSSAY
ncbi:hypothetical protein GH714_044002 [Hevea brasiliensis]|uniref:Uncharacterized protein n=1 Tax=Hevea brasiliensis TaxID=3981 RepID=A0A6A6K1Q7_HEVBR|nr:hypothetical protein GH714_044002 [Hevea brasiliensis]